MPDVAEIPTMTIEGTHIFPEEVKVVINGTSRMYAQRHAMADGSRSKTQRENEALMNINSAIRILTAASNQLH